MYAHYCSVIIHLIVIDKIHKCQSKNDTRPALHCIAHIIMIKSPVLFDCMAIRCDIWLAFTLISNHLWAGTAEPSLASTFAIYMRWSIVAAKCFNSSCFNIWVHAKMVMCAMLHICVHSLSIYARERVYEREESCDNIDVTFIAICRIKKITCTIVIVMSQEFKWEIKSSAV